MHNVFALLRSRFVYIDLQILYFCIPLLLAMGKESAWELGMANFVGVGMT